MNRLRSPIIRIGGKGTLAPRLLKLFPEHQAYIEPFCGGASMFFIKCPVQLEVLNDTDKTLISFFKMLRDPVAFKRFYELISLTPYSRADYMTAYTWREEPDELERLRKWFVVNRQAFGGIYGRGWSHNVKVIDVRTYSKNVGAWLHAIAALPEVAGRLRQAQLECLDYQACLTKYDAPGAFFYIDPPYIPETRAATSYKHELTLDDHKALVTGLLRLQGKVLLSGYRHDVYKQLESAGWRTIDISYAQGAVLTKGKGGAIRKIETLWLNYDN